MFRSYKILNEHISHIFTNGSSWKIYRSILFSSEEMQMDFKFKGTRRSLRWPKDAPAYWVAIKEHYSYKPVRLCYVLPKQLNKCEHWFAWRLSINRVPCVGVLELNSGYTCINNKNKVNWWVHEEDFQVCSEPLISDDNPYVDFFALKERLHGYAALISVIISSKY